MFRRNLIVIVGALMLSGASSFAHATETDIEGIRAELTENQRALRDQAEYRTYYMHMRQLREQQDAAGTKAIRVSQKSRGY